MDFQKKMHGGALYQSMDESVLAEQLQYLDLLYDFNQTRPTEQDKRTASSSRPATSWCASGAPRSTPA